jgi:hypothetical protein
MMASDPPLDSTESVGDEQEREAEVVLERPQGWRTCACTMTSARSSAIGNGARAARERHRDHDAFLAPRVHAGSRRAVAWAGRPAQQGARPDAGFSPLPVDDDRFHDLSPRLPG